MKHKLSITEDFDKYLAISGAILSVILIGYLYVNIGSILYVLTGVLTFISCTIWLLIRKSTFLEFNQSKSCLMILLAFIFTVLFTSSVLVIYFRPNLYERPLSYFILTALMTGVTALEIVLSQGNKKYLILFQIIIIGLSLTWSQSLIFPSVVGVDPWWHQMFTLKIINLTHIPKGHLYSHFPLMHLGIGVTSLITGLNYKLSTMFSMGLFQVIISTLFVFLLGKFLFNEKVGLLSGLLLSTANYYINRSFWMIPTTIAVLFIPIIIYLLFRRSERKMFYPLSIFLLVTLILIHPLTTLCMIMILFIGHITSKIYTNIYPNKTIPIPATVIVFLGILTLGWWFYDKPLIKTLMRLVKLGFNSRKYFVHGSTEYISAIPLLERLFNNFGVFLFFSLAFIGCFYMISKKYGNLFTFVQAAMGITPLFFGFFSLIIGWYTIQERWWYFSQILLALPLAITFFLFYGMIKNKSLKALVPASLVTLLAFFMIMSPIANMDNAILSPNTSIRYALTESEMQAMKTSSCLWNGTIGSDNYYSIMRWNGYRTKDISNNLYKEDFSKIGNMLILIRGEIINKPFKMYQLPYKLNYDLRDVLSNQGFSKIYDCSSVSGFVNAEEKYHDYT